MRKCHFGCLHRRLVEDYYAAVEAQRDQVEAWSCGYATETAEYYETVEPKLTFKSWLIGSRTSRDSGA
jgi:hypothetical protein